MSMATEVILSWAPWATGMALASIQLRNSRDFPADDIGNGEWGGKSGRVAVGVSGAAIALNAYLLLHLLARLYKMRHNKFQNRNGTTVTRTKAIVYIATLAFAVMVIVLGALTNIAADDFDGNTVHVNSYGRLDGEIGTGIQALSITALTLGAVIAGTSLVSEFSTRNATVPSYVETHSYAL